MSRNQQGGYKAGVGGVGTPSPTLPLNGKGKGAKGAALMLD